MMDEASRWRPSMTWTVGGIAFATALAMLLGMRVGAAALTVLVVIALVLRVVSRNPSRAVFVVRRRRIDVAVLGVFSVALAVLTVILND